MPQPKDHSAEDEEESPSFEDSFLRLSEMAEQLESGGLTLAEATARFEEGMKLVQSCNEMLSNAELRITELKETYNSAASQPESYYLDDDLDEDVDEEPSRRDG